MKLRYAFFLFALNVLSACDPSENCYPLYLDGCWEGDDDEVLVDPYVPPVTPEPTYDPDLQLATDEWIVPIDSSTQTGDALGLTLAESYASYVPHGGGGLLMVKIDAEKAELSCGLTLTIQVEDQDELKTPVNPAAFDSVFQPETLRTGCLGSGKGAKQGLAIFELSEKPSRIQLKAFERDQNAQPQAVPDIPEGTEVSIARNSFTRTVNVIIRNLTQDPIELLPLSFEGADIALPFFKTGTYGYTELGFDQEVRNLKVLDNGHGIEYQLELTNSVWIDYSSLHKVHISSASVIP